MIVQIDYTYPGGFSVEKHVCVRKKSFSLSFLNLERNISNFYPEHFSEEMSIVLFRCSEDRSDWSSSSKRYQVFFLYLAKMRKKFNFGRKFFERFATTIAARWTISITFFQMKDKFLLIFGLWTKKVAFWPFSFRQVCKICSLGVRMNCLIIGRTLFPGRVFFFSRTIIKNVEAGRASFNSLVKTAFWSPTGTFKEKLTLTFFWN